MMKEKLITRTLPKVSPIKRQAKPFEAMTDAEIESRALADKDNLPLTKQELASFKRVNPVKTLDIKAIRERLGLSQTEFASYFGISLRTLQQWEQGRQKPNPTALNFLKVVEREPLAVQRALR